MNFKICPDCETEYCDWVETCKKCGKELIPIEDFSPMLRLDRDFEESPDLESTARDRKG